MTARRMVPILRMFDEKQTRDFYVGFLGFEVLFEHRFDDDLPLYLGLRFGECELHLSGHFGDATPGGHLRIEMTGLDEYIDGLRAKDYTYARPGIPEQQEWGTREITIGDPAGNALTFVERD